MKIIQKIVAPTLVVFALLGGSMVLNSPTTHAACAPNSPAKDCVLDGSKVDTGAGTTKGVGELIKTVVDVLLFALGAIAVIMIVVGGIRYAVSGGDSGAVTGAKNTILYAVIGLVIALLAYAIVHFVVKAFVAAEPAMRIIVA